MSRHKMMLLLFSTRPVGIAATVSLLALVAAGTAVAQPAGPGDAEVAARHGLAPADVQRLHQYRKLTNGALFEMSAAAVRRVLWKLDNPRPDQPYGAAEFRQLQQTGGTGQPVPANALGDALA